jgi:hypothetical protein
VLHPSVEHDPVAAADAAHLAASRAQLALLRALAEIERTSAWRHDGARDCAHWASMRYGISGWKAHRWVAAARVLDQLPRIAGALGADELGCDAATELTRFATSATEAGLVAWARGVSPGAVRHRADREVRRSLAETREADRARFLDWWWTDEGRRLGISGELPADQGRVVVAAIERAVVDVPVLPGEEGGAFDTVRRADALVALCAGGVADHEAGDVSGPGPPPAEAGASHDRRACLARGPDERCRCRGARRWRPRRSAHPAAAGVRGEDPGRGRGRLGHAAGPGAHPPGADRGDGPGTAPPRRRVPVPGLRCPPVHPSPPRGVVVQGRTDRSGQPRARVLVPPPVGTRARLGLSRALDGAVRWFRPDGVRYRAGPGPPGSPGSPGSPELSEPSERPAISAASATRAHPLAAAGDPQRPFALVASR